MVKIYAVSLVVGVVALVVWVMAKAFSENIERPSFDPELRFGLVGRRMVAALVGLGMAGLSAEFSPREIPWPLGLLLAVAGAGAATWYAGWADREPDGGEPDTAEPEPT